MCPKAMLHEPRHSGKAIRRTPKSEARRMPLHNGPFHAILLKDATLINETEGEAYEAAVEAQP